MFRALVVLIACAAVFSASMSLSHGMSGWTALTGMSFSLIFIFVSQYLLRKARQRDALNGGLKITSAFYMASAVLSVSASVVIAVKLVAPA
ncbi:hypothetical protein [Dyella tabacisoli]|uniref:Uncharacterized protein n=1 Tax=Dyella tabacisoli TaxID=2282381 RepID=A0A369UMI1_9GAMM|nr:hypothetical protein [Dyella tabacisoli]RDD81553.1 hypothetical protein DVJ77_10265 [Dyella tabacisoli]